MNRRQRKKIEKKQLNEAIGILKKVIIPNGTLSKRNSDLYSDLLKTYKESIKQLDNQPKPQAIFVSENLYTALKELDTCECNKLFKTNQLNYNKVLMIPMTQLTDINPTGFKTTDVSNCTDFYQFMKGCSSTLVKYKPN